MKDTTGERAPLRVGSIQILSLTDAVTPFPLSPSQTFPTVSEKEWREFREIYPNTFSGPSTLSVRIGCSLIRTREHNILVDTGVGPSSTTFSRFIQTDGELPERLREVGLAADDIDVVFLTHLHADHVGWNVGMQDRRPTFTNARYIAPREDWGMCEWRLEHDPKNAAYVRENVIPLLEQGRLELIDEATALADGVSSFRTPGHTPGHMSVKVDSGSGESVWILGDVASHPLQVTNPAHTYVFDIDAELAARTHLRVLEEVEASEGAVVGASHFPEPGVGRLVRRGKKRHWRPIP